MRKGFAARVLAAVRGCEGLLVSDYGSGLVTPALVAEAQRRMQQSFRLKAEATRTPRAAANTRTSRGFHLEVEDRRRPIVLVDSRYNLLRYRGMTACTPNESEVEQALGITIGDNMRVLERAGRAILRRTRATAVLITRGSRGMALFEPDRQTVHIPIVGSDQIADVTGDHDAGFSDWSELRGGGPPRQLRRRHRRHEARNRDGECRGAPPRDCQRRLGVARGHCSLAG
jgi:hypothetical protein